MRISDWSSDVCSSDLVRGAEARSSRGHGLAHDLRHLGDLVGRGLALLGGIAHHVAAQRAVPDVVRRVDTDSAPHPSEELGRSEEHTSDLQSLMSISYDVFCLTKKNRQHDTLRNNRMKQLYVDA